MPIPHSETRRNRRVPLDIYVNKMINGVPFLARTRDISRGGVYVHRLIEPEVPPTARIALEFALPGSEEVIWAEALVVHGDDGASGVGLRFVDLTPRQDEILGDFISSSSAVTPWAIGVKSIATEPPRRKRSV